MAKKHSPKFYGSIMKYFYVFRGAKKDRSTLASKEGKIWNSETTKLPQVKYKEPPFVEPSYFVPNLLPYLFSPVEFKPCHWQIKFPEEIETQKEDRTDWKCQQNEGEITRATLLPDLCSPFVKPQETANKSSDGSLLNANNIFDVVTKKMFNYTAEYSGKGMVVEVDMKGFKEEDVFIRVDGVWLVIEGNMSVNVPEKEGGGLLIRSIVKRYEIPPNSDVANIKTKFANEKLTVTVPALTPSITKE